MGTFRGAYVLSESPPDLGVLGESLMRLKDDGDDDDDAGYGCGDDDGDADAVGNADDDRNDDGKELLNNCFCSCWRSRVLSACV